MSQPTSNGSREPISAARNGASGASVALQTALILWALQHAGVQGTPQEIAAMAAGAAAGWAFLAGAIARVCRDELHNRNGSAGVLRRILLTIGSALG